MGKTKTVIPADVRPPAIPEVEASVLGAMIIAKEAVPKAIELLSPESFYLKSHQLIFDAMVKLFNNNLPVDTVSVYEELKRRNELTEIGGAVYLSKLSQNIPSAANVEYHCKLLIEKQILRGIITAAHEAAKEAYEDRKDAFDLLDEVENKIYQISSKHLIKSYRKIKSGIKDAIEYIETIHSNPQNKFSVPTGFYELDNLLGGFSKSNLIILAARPSMGKTALALTLARNIAIDFQIPVGIFSLEMSEIELIVRMIAAESRVNAHLVRIGKLPKDEAPKLLKGIHKLEDAEIYIDDMPLQSALDIRAKARRMKSEHNIGIIIVDYLQLMEGREKSESREREIAHISRSLKAMAKELNVPVIALSQLNRQIEGRMDKTPQLSDLRESGTIEQDADTVIFIHRPEYYGMEKDENGDSLEGVAEIIVGKQRNGPTGKVKLAFIKDYARFENYTSNRSEQIHEEVIAADDNLIF